MQYQLWPHANARRILTFALTALWLLCDTGAAPPVSAQIVPPLGTFRNFESPQVHPLALTPDGTRLLAVNSPNATLSVFQLVSGSPVLTAEIPVGLEPVSVAARNDREAWVVNWLSDSLSIVDLATGNVTRTIDVGDEPTDVLFAGTNGEKAFVCVSGLGRVLVFDPSDAVAAPQVIDVPGKQPRALARSANGARVFVSVFESGNRTTVVPELTVRLNGGLPPPTPAMAPGLPAAPSTGLIVKWNGTDWVDEINRSWGGLNTHVGAAQRIAYTLADIDLLMIDATAGAPSLVAQARGVGTQLGNMAFDASTGRLFVANLEATNEVRFEPNLRGRFQQSRVSVLDVQPAGLSLNTTQDLNPQVDLDGPGSDAERAQGLAMPADIVRASDGTVYVAATSSARVGVLSATGAVLNRIGVGQGPTGLALDEARSRLYVLNRFDSTVGVIDTNAKSQVSQVAVGFNPEPPAVRAGRKILFDASLSLHGTVSCASCHPSGHRDGLAWDLGDPQGALSAVNGGFLVSNFHPMKGPMTTQSLRGISGTEPLHWRGDRANIAAFNPAFVSLLGGARQLTAQEMADFTAFVQSLTYPPNPNERLDRKLSTAGQQGFNHFQRELLDTAALPCSGCHSVSQTFGGSNITGTGTARVIFPGSLLQETQDFKVPQLRGLYQKMGMDKTPGEKPAGFGFLHDGSNDSIVDFLKNPVFTFPAGATGEQTRRDIEAFLLEFDTGIAPAVGLQVTVNASDKGEQLTLDRVNLLAQQAAAGNCDLVVRGLYGGSPRAFQRLQNGTFQPDSLSEAPVQLQALLAAAGTGSELTFTGVLPGAGRRMSIDTDGDGILNDDEPRTSVSLTGRVVDASGAGISGVVVTLSGAQAAAAVTDSSGRYSFNYVSTAGTHIVTPLSTGLTFTPASRTFANPTWNQSATFITSAAANASDASQFFVSQHYQDFLNREPDASGLNFWTNEIEQCGANPQCREIKRINVSAAFFLSIEFQQTGYLVYRTNKASFGELPGKPAPATFQQLMTDAQRVSRNVVVGQGAWSAQLETNKQAFFLGWVQRPEFLARYPLGMSATDFVNALNSNTGGSLSTAERDALAGQLSSNNTTQGRAAVLRQVAENTEFTRREVNRAFVLMQYFGYLRRNPDDAPEPGLNFEGYNFWLAKLDQFGGNFVSAEMVKAFITSIEYRKRFGQP